MATRYAIIERIARLVYGEQPSDSSNVTVGLINSWINDAIGVAAKQNYKESIQMDGINYVNNSFYTTFKGITVAQTEPFTFQVILPQIPFGIGKNEGVSSLTFVDASSNISFDAIPISANQVGYFRNLKSIPYKIIYYSESYFLYAISTLTLTSFTARVKMVSGGDSTNINSVLNVPDDYIPIIIDYCTQKLILERNQPKEVVNDKQESSPAAAR